MTRLLFTNNYDMQRARAGWRCGTYPAHHLFGTACLHPEFDVSDIGYRPDDLLARATRSSRGRLGDLGVQLRTGRRIETASIIYAAQARDVTTLAVLRRAGLISAPLVGIFHRLSGGAPLGRLPFGGFDRVIALGESIRAALIDRGVPADRISVLGWGPDLEFPGFAGASRAGRDASVVATGKSGRDLTTLIEALRRTGAPGRVFGDRASLLQTCRIPDRVEVRPAVSPKARAGAPLTYAHTLQDLRSAAVVAIPLNELYPYQGLTELADAIGCARPVIVTRAPYFDIDIESIECGWWVEKGDVDGWCAAISQALSDRGRLAEMGEAGRRWAAEHWNARLFADGLRRILAEVGGNHSP